MLKPVYLAAFSGHRPENSEGRTSSELLGIASQLEESLADLKQRVESTVGELHFVSSLAAGSDLIACRAAIRLGLPLHIFLPQSERARLGSCL